MDVLLIFLAISGLVFAGVMVLLASRTARMERESSARVDRLQSMATGSVLFTAVEPVQPDSEALAEVAEAEIDAPAEVDASAHTARILAWDEFAGTPRADEVYDNTDLDGIAFSDRRIDWAAPATPEPQPAPLQQMPQMAPGTYVLHVPEDPRDGRVFSFKRAERRSTT